MEVVYKTGDGRFTIKFVAETETGLVEELASLQDLLERNTVCGLCKSHEVLFSVRSIEGNKYFERKCECGASQAMSQYKPSVKKGGLFTKYDSKWVKWQPKHDENEVVEESVKTTKKNGK